MYAKKIEGGFQLAALAALFPDVSFPDSGPDAQWLADAEVYPVEEYLYFDADAFKRNGIEPVLRDGVVYTAELVALTDEDKAQRTEEKSAMRAQAVREQRNRLLAESDWTQLGDYQGRGKSAWVAYRRALRDVTKQSGFPDEVVWPERPS